MFKFLKIQREMGNVSDEMLDLYLDVFISQEECEKLKAIEVKTQ